MIITWKPEGGVQLVDLTTQEFGWLKRELGRATPPVVRDAGDAFVEQLRQAVPINAVVGTKAPDLTTPVL